LLQISTLFPGSVTVSGNNGRQKTLAMDSLESAGLQLPEGNYSVEIVYRNSHRESRIVEVVNNSSMNIAFTYRPNLDARSFSGTLPAFGVNIAELNPSGYRNIDQNVLTSMGMEQYRVSFLAGEKYYQNGDYDRAITEYNRSISLKTNYADAYIARGSAYRKKGSSLRAIEDYTKALEYGGIRAEVYNYRGYAYAERGEIEKAISDFSQALRLSRDYADAYINRAHAYYEKGDFDRAIDDYSHVIQLEPRNASAWNRRGSAWYRKGENENAVSDFSRAIGIWPDYALAWHNRGNVWFNAGNYEKALADLNQVIKLAPSSGAYTSRGNILLKLGDSAGAEADFAAARR
jgi:tetratricopeptide (TPR) repeat protein